MYHMKNIINHNENITLPTSMYMMKNPNESLRDEIDQINVHISGQGPKTKMADLEQRQEQLKNKLDILYDRIKTISTYCNVSSNDGKAKSSFANSKANVLNPEEVVLVANPDNLPYYLNKILRDTASVNLSWHIHSSVPNEKVPKINGFVKNLPKTDNSAKINLRLIFKSVSADSELKLSSLSEPIVGTVNTLRYLSYAYPNSIPYNDADFKVDSLLDICHLLEKTPDKNKENLFKKIFVGAKDWIYNNEFSILDLAVYNVAKQSRNSVKFVPKSWFDKCEKMFS